MTFDKSLAIDFLFLMMSHTGIGLFYLFNNSSELLGLTIPFENFRNTLANLKFESINLLTISVQNNIAPIPAVDGLSIICNFYLIKILSLRCFIFIHYIFLKNITLHI